MEAGYGGFIDVAASLCQHKIKSKFYIKAKNRIKANFMQYLNDAK